MQTTDGSSGSTKAFLSKFPLDICWRYGFCWGCWFIPFRCASISFDRNLIKVSVEPLQNHSLKWELPGSSPNKGFTLPLRYVDPNIGISTLSAKRCWIGISKDLKSSVWYFSLTNTIRRLDKYTFITHKNTFPFAVLLPTPSILTSISTKSRQTIRISPSTLLGWPMLLIGQFSAIPVQVLQSQLGQSNMQIFELAVLIFIMNFYSFPAWSLSGSHKGMMQQDIHASPGPIYDTSDPSTSGPTWKIGSSKRSSMGTTDVPLPGSYNLPEFKTDQNKYSIPKDVPKETLNQNPGPGLYNPAFDPIKPKISAATMAYKYDSDPADKRNIPGPGQYQIEIKPSVTAKKSKFTTSSRKSLGGDPTVPGPGQYDISRPNTAVKNHSISIGKAKRISLVSETPGPGAYSMTPEIDLNMSRKKGYSLSSKLLVKPFESGVVSPGPGNYDNVTNPLYKAPSYSIGKSARKIQSKTISPGPLDYMVKADSNIRSGTMTRALGHNLPVEGAETPGPGTYAHSQSQAKSYSIPRSKSMLNTRSLNPGPGQYRPTRGIAQQLGKGITIGNSKRYNMVSRGVPGPGDYGVTYDLGYKSSGISIGKEVRREHKNQNPGPGHYLHQTTVSNLSKYALYKPPEPL